MSEQFAKPRIAYNGDTAIAVEFGRAIDPQANLRVLALDRALSANPIAGVREAVPTYRSLLVHYDPVAVSAEMLAERLLQLAEQPLTENRKFRHWRIPVNYGGENGIDLDDVARTLDLSTDEVIALHSGGEHCVAMIGFTPGWSYLTGMNAALHISRRDTPRVHTPAGTISIGGVQSGVQCLAGPSGWNLLGRTAVQTYRINRTPPFLLEPGDIVSFMPVDLKTFEAQEKAAEKGELIAERLA